MILRLILHGDGTTILRGQPSHAKVLRIEVKYIRHETQRVEDTPRSGVFLTNFKVSNASYYFSNKMILEGETKDAKMNSFSSDFQTLID